MNRIRTARAGRRSLDDWLNEWYAPAYRTAYLILLDRQEADRAVHEAFIRSWRMRAAIPGGHSTRTWVFRAVFNACSRRLVAGAEDRINAEWTGLPGRLAGLAHVAPELRRPLALMAGGLDAPSIAEITHRRPEAVERALTELLSRLDQSPADPSEGGGL